MAENDEEQYKQDLEKAQKKADRYKQRMNRRKDRLKKLQNEQDEDTKHYNEEMLKVENLKLKHNADQATSVVGIAEAVRDVLGSDIPTDREGARKAIEAALGLSRPEIKNKQGEQNRQGNGQNNNHDNNHGQNGNLNNNQNK